MNPDGSFLTNGTEDELIDGPRRRTSSYTCFSIILGIVAVGTVACVVGLILVAVMFAGHRDAKCADKNPCTEDLAWRGGCLNINEHDGKECASVCLAEEDAQQCMAGQCSGTCLGECEVVGDCPNVTLLGTPQAEECQNSVCLWSTNLPSGVVAGSEQFNKDQCDAYIAASNVVAECLVSNAVVDTLANEITSCNYHFACAQAQVPLLI